MRRLQFFLDDERYRRLAAAAQERGTSIEAVIREAIEAALAVDLTSKRRAAAALLAAPAMPVPDTVEELKAELRDRVP